MNSKKVHLLLRDALEFSFKHGFEFWSTNRLDNMDYVGFLDARFPEVDVDQVVVVSLTAAYPMDVSLIFFVDGEKGRIFYADVECNLDAKNTAHHAAQTRAIAKLRKVAKELGYAKKIV